jgi:3-oxoacyl-[acyl-carrier protein] reductase
MKTVIISGASRGIGRATAALYTQKNYQVINLSRTPCDITNVINIAVDFADFNWPNNNTVDITAKLAQASRIDLIHNAAYLLNDSVAEIDPSQLQKSLQINVIAPAQLNRIILPYMAAGSSIIYIGSTLAEKAVANCASYSTSKHALAGLMKATCQDLQATGIHSCCICPGFTDTPMLRTHLNHQQELINGLAKTNAAGRLVTPQEIANTIFFCTHNPVINGAIIHANLGQRES